MKVNPNVNKAQLRDQTTEVQSRAKQAQAKATDDARSQKVSNNQGFTVNKAKAKVDAEPDIRMDKVKALRDQIKKGTYKVDTAKLAGNILKDSAIEDV